MRRWLDWIREELAARGDPERVPFLGRGRAARAWRRTALVRSLGALAIGTAWDLWSRPRIDRWQVQVGLALSQLGFAALVVLQLRAAAERRVPAFVKRHPELVHDGSQLLLGNLLGAFVTYYLRGTASGGAALFSGLLIALLVANELVRPLRVGWARISLLAFCQFNGLLFALPVWTGRLVPPWVAAALAVGSIGAALLLVRPTVRAVGRGLAPAVATLAAVLILVWAQVLPPLPLSLQRIGVFHSVEPNPTGYALTWEREPVLGPLLWRYDRVFHRQPGDSVACFSAVFVPTGMALPIVHRWERYGPDGWVEVDRVTLDVVGGRTGGYRTFSRKENLATGSWRVLVELPTGRELGRIAFELVDRPPEHRLVTEVF